MADKPRQWQPMFNGMLGLKQGYAITNMPPGSCLDIKNMFLNGIGGKTPRSGYVQLFHTTDNLGTTRYTDRIRSLIQYNPFGGSSQVLAYAGTRIYKQNGTNSTIVASTDAKGAAIANDTPWEWIQYRDKILGVNGTNSSFLYNGTAYYTISLTAPTTHMAINVATPVAGGSLGSGASDTTYEYLMTFYDINTGRESNPFTVATAPSFKITVAHVGAGTRTIRLDTFPVVPSGEGITHRRLYRRATGETQFSRIAEFVSATASYDDTGAASSSLYLVYDTGTQDEGNTAHPLSGLIAECFDRIFMVPESDPSTLVYSKVGEYHAFPSGNYYYVGRGDGSRIKRIEKHGKALLIHKGNAWYILEADPAANGVVRQLSGVGTQDYRTSASAHNQVVRLTTTGFYRSVPTDYSVTDLREDYIGSDVADHESQIDWGNSGLASMYNYNAYNRRHVYYIEPKPASYYSKCLVFDIVLSQWVYFEIGTDVYCCADYYDADDKKFMIMGDGYGIVWQWDVGGCDGVNIIADLSHGTATSATATTLVDTTKVDVNGIGTAGGAATLTDTSKTWTVNQWVGKPVYIKSGLGSVQSNTILSNTADTITVTAPWTAPVGATSVYQIGGWVANELVGTVVATWEGQGGSQRRRIISNTPDTVEVDAAWTTNPDATTTYTVAGIEKMAEEYWDSNGDPHVWKRMRWVVPYVRQTGAFDVEISFRRDFARSLSSVQTLNLAVSPSLSLWGVFLWGANVWATAASNLRRIRLHGKYHYYSVKYKNRNGAEPFYWDGHGAVFQVLYDRNK